MRRAARRAGRLALAAALAAPLGAPAGCTPGPDRVLESHFATAEFGEARRRAFQTMDDARSEDRALALLRYLTACLADGYPSSAEEAANELFDLLRRQGLNEDKTLAAVALNEDLKRWKGEPFEQAMAYHAIALQKAQLAEWGNARAAANASLFLLKSFADDAGAGREPTKRRLAELAAEAEARGDGPYLDRGYQPVRTDFALGYLAAALANSALGRADEAADNLREAWAARPSLRPVCDRLLAGDFDTVLVVDHGLAPEKFASGPGGAFAAYRARTPSDGARLLVRVGDSEAEAFPVACDVNEMARDLRWNGLQDVRLAKATFGRAATLTGAILATSGDEATAWAGLGLLLAGVFLEAGAHADTRHGAVLPQRVYVAPVTLGAEAPPVELEIEGRPGTRLVVGPPWPEARRSPFRVVSVRLGETRAAPAWATSGRTLYANAGHPGPPGAGAAPYILGGRCVRPPSHRALRDYQAAGVLVGATLADLEALYRAEGIEWDETETGGAAWGHVLEGGRSLVAPRPGSAGYARVFGREHPPYRARSALVRDAARANAGAVRGPAQGDTR